MLGARWGAFLVAGLACIAFAANRIGNVPETHAQTRPLTRAGRPDNRPTAALDVPEAVSIAMQCDALLNQYRTEYFLPDRDEERLGDIGSKLRGKLYELDAKYKVLHSEGQFSYNMKRLAAEFNILQRKHLQAYMALVDVLQNPHAYPPLAPTDETEGVVRMAMSEAHRLSRTDLAEEAFGIAARMMPQFGVRMPFPSHLQYPDFSAGMPVRTGYWLCMGSHCVRARACLCSCM